MVQRHLTLDRIAPWLVSGASGCYVVARARRLRRARASRAPWLRFLVRQSDMILMLFGGPAVWHFARRRSAVRRHESQLDGDRAALSASVTHQLRQVFTVLLLGLGLIARKATEGKTAEIIALALRLQNIARSGARVLTVFDEPLPASLVPVGAAIYDAHLPENGLLP